MTTKIFLAVFVIVGFAVVADSYPWLLKYTFRVQTGDGFNQTSARIELLANTFERILLKEGQYFDLSPKRIYDMPAYSQITASIWWKLALQVTQKSSPTNITIDSITVIPTFYQEPTRSKYSHKFCPDGLITSGSLVELHKC